MFSVIDTHTHLFDDAFQEDQDAVYARAVEAGVGKLFLPNIDDTTIDDLLNYTSRHENCFPLIGFHPTSVDENWESRLDVVHEALQSNACFKGIGEVGLDLYWDNTFVEEQKIVLNRQIQWALQSDYPIIIHCRKAHQELMEVFAPYKTKRLRGIFHSFAGNEEEAAQLLDYTEFMLGVNGIVTFKKSTLPDVLKKIPIDRLVLETDSPYLAPVPYRGKRNESAYIVKVAEKLAEIYQISPQEVARITSDNALKVFKNVG